MKWKPVLCVALLALAAGCKSQQNPYASFGEYGFTYDLVQYPVPGLTVAESERIAEIPSASPTMLWSPAVPNPILMKKSSGNMTSEQSPAAPEKVPVEPAAPVMSDTPTPVPPAGTPPPGAVTPSDAK